MKKVKTLVIDDEVLARKRLVKLLQSDPDVDILTECKNVAEARKSILELSPDLIFLDIQMPDGNGVDLMESLSLIYTGFVIFVTAFDQYALKAFDVQAMDYLLKPFDDERFFKALNHAKEKIKFKELATNINEENDSNSNNYEEKYLQFKDRGMYLNLPVSQIVSAESDGNYLRIQTELKSYFIRHSLKEFESKFENCGFLRIHKAVIVGLSFIDDVLYKGNNHYKFVMKNEKEYLSGRHYREGIHDFLRSSNI